jgi:2-C-methyl-D-erythritol 4-phosphate cytidylyltransferase
MSVAAVIVAAGPGSRLGAGVPKALVPLAGIALFIHALRAVAKAPSISTAVVVTPPGLAEAFRTRIDSAGPWPCPITTVDGGAERQESVRHGLAAVADAPLVAIHDAARPFIARDVVEAAIAVAREHGAAVVAVPATDTVKQVHPDGWIEATLPRERMWLAQTPQVFRTDLIRTVHASAPTGLAATDDAVLVERCGLRVYVVPGNPENRKITTPDDLRWAECLLAQSVAPR